MSSHTPAGLIFRELSDVHGLILDFITAPGTQIRHWPTYYRLYLDIDELGWLVSRATEYLAEQFIDNDGHVDPERVESANYCFSQFTVFHKAIVSRLGYMERHPLVSCSDKGIKHRLRAHLQPKSDWYTEFHERYCAGKVSPDGKTLERTVFLIDPEPTYRIPDLYEKNLVQQHSFDLSTKEARAALISAARQVQNQMGKVYTVLGDYFVEHCSTKDLLHPSTY